MVDLLFYISFLDEFYITVCYGTITISALWLSKGRVNINEVPYDLMWTWHLLRNSKENGNFFPKMHV